MSEIQGWIERAKQGKSVYLYRVRDLFEKIGTPIWCELYYADGIKRFELSLLKPESKEQEEFIQEYFYATLYNMISVLGGYKMVVYAQQEDAFLLANTLNDVFGVSKSKAMRSGYEKCLNVAERINSALGLGRFQFDVRKERPKAAQKEEQPHNNIDVVEFFCRAVKKAEGKRICGIDIGGTDIKIVTIKDGKIDHIKEYDWFPAMFHTIDEIVDTVELIVKLSAALASLPDDCPEEIELVKQRVLDLHATKDQMEEGLGILLDFVGEAQPFHGVGLCFPDVVIQNMIVGGETYKTKGVREHSSDYEKEFAKLTGLNTILQRYCFEDGVVHITNDGPMAAFTAAVELSLSEQSEVVRNGIFAHTLGTELGTGWIDERGKVPELPLEVYNCIIDLGNYPARKYAVNDVRSLNNFNTGLAGTLQKYTSQSGAFRLAQEYYSEQSSVLYAQLFEKNFIQEEAGQLELVVEPKDMRKPFLEHLMQQAQEGQELAVKIFETIGEYMAATWMETEYILSPKVKDRVLFGRFVKREASFLCMQRGAAKILPEVSYIAANDELAYSPVMCELRDDPCYTVAQFGQAVGAIYFASSILP